MKRRDLLKTAAGVAAVGVPVLGVRVLGGSAQAFAQSEGYNGVPDVGNYLLTLTYLKEDYYRQGIAASLVSGVEAGYIDQILADKQVHVATLTQIIRDDAGTPVGRPAVSFGGAFDSRDVFLKMALDIENCCIQAYLDALGSPEIFPNKPVVQAVSGLYGVAARHAAMVGLMGGTPAAGGVFKGPTETPAPRGKVLADLSPLFADPQAMAGGAAVTQ